MTMRFLGDRTLMETASTGEGAAMPPVPGTTSNQVRHIDAARVAAAAGASAQDAARAAPAGR
jgi:hypothetical protein